MPTWLILTVAGVIVVVGAALPVTVRARRARSQAAERAIRAARARAEAVGYRIDAADGADGRVSEAARLRDLALATLSVASRRRSVAACADAEDLLDRAERELSDG